MREPDGEGAGAASGAIHAAPPGRMDSDGLLSQDCAPLVLGYYRLPLRGTEPGLLKEWRPKSYFHACFHAWS
jgi:hypothetical protein